MRIAHTPYAPNTQYITYAELPVGAVFALYRESTEEIRTSARIKGRNGHLFVHDGVTSYVEWLPDTPQSGLVECIWYTSSVLVK